MDRVELMGVELLVWGVIFHLIADWLLQSNWMAVNKKSFVFGRSESFFATPIQPQPNRQIGHPGGALFQMNGPKSLGIAGAEAFTGCGDTKNAGSKGSRRLVLTQGSPVSEV